MATQIPPHCIREIIEVLIHLMDDPHLNDERLYALVPGPDFPTGGEPVHPHTISQVCRTGRGGLASGNPGHGQKRRLSLRNC